MALVWLLPVAFALFFLWQTVVYGGVRIARGHTASTPVAGYVLTVAFLGLAAAGAVITGWLEWVRIDRRAQRLTCRAGGLFPWWKRHYDLTDYWGTRVVEVPAGPGVAGPLFDVWLEGRARRVRLASFTVPAEAEALAGRVAQFLGLTREDHAVRRAEQRAEAARARRSPVEFSVRRAGGRIALRVGGRSAEWAEVDGLRGGLYALTPAKSGGEIALWTRLTDGTRRDLLVWSAYDDEIWQVLREHEAELRGLFRDGLEIHVGADA